MKNLSHFKCSNPTRRVKRKELMKTSCYYCTAPILVENPFREVNNNGHMKKLTCFKHFNSGRRVKRKWRMKIICYYSTSSNLVGNLFRKV
jgi:hypothetical protein